MINSRFLESLCHHGSGRSQICFKLDAAFLFEHRCFPENIAKLLTKDFFYRTHENILMITKFSSLKIVNKVFLLTTLFLK